MISLGGFACASTDEVDEQSLDRRRVVADVLVARADLARQFDAVERRFARHRRAVVAPGFELPRQNRHHRVGDEARGDRSDLSSPSARPNTRCPTSAATVCSTSLGSRESRKHPAKSPNHLQTPIRGGWPPPSDVSAPPSNPATTGRPSTRPNTLHSAIHSICIGLPLRISLSRCCNTIFARLAARCATKCEKAGYRPQQSQRDPD